MSGRLLAALCVCSLLLGPRPSRAALLPEPAPWAVFFVPLQVDPGLGVAERPLRDGLVATLIRDPRFVEALGPEAEVALRECAARVNTDATAPTCWLRIGQGRGAQLMVTGRVRGTPSACEVTLRLVDLERRVTLRMHHHRRSPCDAAGLEEEFGAGARSLLALASAAGADEPGGAAAAPSNPAGLDWVALEGGSFLMGSDDGERDERPVRRLTLPPFELARSEVTVAQYEACVSAGACRAPATEPRPACVWGQADVARRAVNCLDWQQASDFCAWAGGRLPSEAEWEFAASGGEGRLYPWGSEGPAQGAVRANYDGYDHGDGFDRAQYRRDGHEYGAPVCSYPAGQSRHGLCDLAGNLREWTATAASEDSVGSGGALLAGGLRVLRGGSWQDPARALRASARRLAPPGERSATVGLRCAR